MIIIKNTLFTLDIFFILFSFESLVKPYKSDINLIIVRWIDNYGSSIGKRTIAIENLFHKTSYVITSKKVKEKERKKIKEKEEGKMRSLNE